MVLHSIFTQGGNCMETRREKARKEGTKMSPVSWSEPRLLMWEQRGFSRGRNVAREHPQHLHVIDRVTLAAEERLLSRREANSPANYPDSCGHIQRLRVKRRGQLSQRLRTKWPLLSTSGEQWPRITPSHKQVGGVHMKNDPRQSSCICLNEEKGVPNA